MNLHYQITPLDPFSHLFDIAFTIQTPKATGQVIRLPNWIPGSYLIRDFAKNILNLRAETCQDNTPLTLTPINQYSWQVAPCDDPICIRYKVYGWDLSVRSAHFDQTHAFFNGTSVFMLAEGFEHQACNVRIHASEFAQKANWQVATGMPAIMVNPQGFGEYRAENYMALIDYPVEMGTFHKLEFVANGVPHSVVFTGRIDWQTINQPLLVDDLTRICETELSLFGAPYPMQNYLFMVMVTDKDYGGLEHQNSTALLCSRKHLPQNNDGDTRTDDYLQFLELCAHEYFHTWNVKNIQPLAYQQTQLEYPALSEQLWWFEGATSYYDALILYRAGILSISQYLDTLAKQITLVTRMPGRFQLSVAESSFFTWTKFYQQNENAPNAIISYYTKGSIIALALDLIIRKNTQNKQSLDNVLLKLWQEYGLTRIGVPEKAIEAICSDTAQTDLTDFFAQAIYGTTDIDLAALLADFGIDFTLRPATHQLDKGGQTDKTRYPIWLGASLSATGQGSVKLNQVWQNSSAHQAGLAAGDEIIALQGIKMTSPESIETLLKNYSENDQLECHYFRRDELYQTRLTLTQPIADRVVLSVNLPLDNPLQPETTKWVWP